MDKTIKYQKAILDLFQEYDEFWGHSGGLENRIVADTKRNAYVLISFGWQNDEKYTHLLCFHVEIINGKVWIHENNTEAMIADELVEKGVAKEDIVLGFLEPDILTHSDIAVA
jgi:XisI protein